MDICDVNDSARRQYKVRRVFLPTLARESLRMIGLDWPPVAIVDEYLACLTDCERSPNAVNAYAHDLRVSRTSWPTAA